MSREWGVGAALFAAALLYFGLLASYGLNVGEEGGVVYLFYRTLTGQRPYIDFFSGYAPAYFYWHALILHLFDANLLAIRFCLALVNSLSVLLLYTVARTVLPLRFAVLPGMAYLALLPAVPAISCSFNVPYPSWYQLPLWLLGIHALRRWSARGGAGWLLLAGLLAGISCSFKPNTGLFNLAADALCVVMVCGTAMGRKGRMASVRTWLVVTGIVGGVMFVFRGHLWRREGWIFVVPILALIGAWVSRGTPAERDHAGSKRRGNLVRAMSALLGGFAVMTMPWLLYYYWQLGWTRFAHNVLLIDAGYEQFFYLPYRALAWRDVAVALGVSGCAALIHACRRHWLSVQLVAALVAAAVAAAVAWILLVAPMPEGFQRAVQLRVQDLSFGGALVIHWAVITVLWVRGFPRMRDARGRDLVFVLVSALFMLLSAYPRSDFFHLSFSIPLTLVLGAVLLDWLAGLWGDAVPVAVADWIRWGAFAAVCAVLVVIAAPQVGLCRQVAAHFFGGPEGDLTRLQLRRAPVLVRNDAAGQAALNLEPVVEYLEQQRRPGDQLFTFPNLDLICFLADLHTPARIGYFTPGLPDHIGEAEVVDTLATHMPRFAVVSNPAPLFFADAPAYYFILRDFIASTYTVQGRAGSYVVLLRAGAQAGSFVPPARGEARAPAPSGDCADIRALLALGRGFARQSDTSLDTAREKTALTRDERKSAFKSTHTPFSPSSRLLLAAYRGARLELAGKALGRLRTCLTTANPAMLATLIQTIRESESADAAAILTELWAQGTLAARSKSIDLLVLRVVGEIGDARAGAALLAAPTPADNERRDLLSTALFNIAARGMIAPFQFGQDDAPGSTVVSSPAYDAQLRQWAFSPDEDIRRRFFAVWVLGHGANAKPTASIADDLSPLLVAPNPGLQLAAAVALSELSGSRDTGERLLDLLSVSPSFLPSLVLRWSRSHSDMAAPLLSRVLEHGEPAQREVVSFIAGVLRWPTLVPSLRVAATAPQPRVRLASVWALGRIGDSATAAVGRAALSDTDSDVRGFAAVAAGRMTPALPAISRRAPRYAANRRRLLGVNGVCVDLKADFRSSRVSAVFSRAVSREVSDCRAKPMTPPE